MAEIKAKKGGAINGRISTELRGRLTRITERWGPNDTTMLEDALSALADYVDRHGSYERPMRMDLDTERIAHDRQLAAEAPAEAASAVASTITRRLRKEEQERTEKRLPARK